ncbi:uncharacterized protein LOC125235356 [Leguminivora glycinivorella]|uniref:uncharacterized protein LOC125235356 n=1 Tax=Leguminivora glycinivorella TaxID=1035111 RepID=UPI00200D87DB|nr:uncharacterized protein LOC125235356 [Leguminivora glycinivorella]
MESKRRCQCCSPSICCGMPIEKGCFIFSIINAIICSLGSLASLGFLILILYLWCNPEALSDVVVDWTYIGVSVGSCIGSGIALFFAILLCYGLRKNKKRYIMTYLIYGMVSVTLGAIGTVVFIWLEWGQLYVVLYAMIPLGVCVIYSAMLLLVYQTYVVLSERTPVTGTGHTRLLNTEEF